MKKHLDAVLVVEGKSDVAYLSNYLDADFVITNGSCIPEETINYLKNISQNREIIVLTDPDYPGKRIRDVLDQNIPNLKHCFIRKEYAVKNGKVGVAECDINEIFEALDNKFVQSKNDKPTLNMSDLQQLGLTGSSNSNELRMTISSKLHLGYNNAKSLLNRLNSLKITRKELEELLDE